MRRGGVEGSYAGSLSSATLVVTSVFASSSLLLLVLEVGLPNRMRTVPLLVLGVGITGVGQQPAGSRRHPSPIGQLFRAPHIKPSRVVTSRYAAPNTHRTLLGAECENRPAYTFTRHCVNNNNLA